MMKHLSNFQGSESQTKYMNFLEAAFFSNQTVYNVQSQCSPDFTFSLPLDFGSVAVQQGSQFVFIAAF